MRNWNAHDRTGRYRNHRQTAALLARNGYVVVALEHALDRKTRNSKAIINARVREFSAALESLFAHPLVGDIADEKRVGAVGYSLGTLSALYAAGATPNWARSVEHCELHYAQDANFCAAGRIPKWRAIWDGMATWLRNIASLGGDSPVATAEFKPVATPIDFDAVALVAPIGVPFPPKELRRLRIPVALFRLGDDEQLRYPYHAEYLRLHLPQPNLVYKNFPNTHHYAFISPFPKWLLEEEYIPVAIDPDGFDRAQFISEINADLLRFFDANLR